VILADDDVLLREDLLDPCLRRGGPARRGARPDVVLIDIRPGEESGLGAARQLAASGQSTTLIMISTHAETDYADLIVEGPVTGFLPKAELPAAAIRRILGTS
jgi:DNA-binding NarL/FixJ family response regulator